MEVIALPLVLRHTRMIAPCQWLTQSEEGENRQYHDDQTDKVDETVQSVGLVAILFWFGIELWRTRSTGIAERPMNTGQSEGIEEPALREKINQMLFLFLQFLRSSKLLACVAQQAVHARHAHFILGPFFPCRHCSLPCLVHWPAGR